MRASEPPAQPPMAVTFSRTLRSLGGDPHRPALVGVVCGVGLVLAWLGWLVGARVSVFEVATDARVEVEGTAHRVEAPVTGRVVSVDLEVGRRVPAGHPLATLETAAESSRLEEERAQLASLEEQLQRLGAARQAAADARSTTGRADQAAVEQAQAESRQATSALRLAESRLRRSSELGARGLVADSEQEAVEAEAEQRRTAVDAAGRNLARLEWQRRQYDSEGQARLAELDQGIAAVTGELAGRRAALKGLEHALALRVIRAPVDGWVAEVEPVAAGGVVEEGDLVAVIVPDGQLKVVAHFPAAAALGRVHPGQEAELRLEAYPWLQYGTVAGRVTAVGSEANQGQVRVEAAPALGGNAAVPLQHGLEGTLAVEVERVSPAVLLLRAVGRRLSPTRVGTGAVRG